MDRCVALLRRSVHAHFPSVTLLRELLSLVSWGLSEAPKESPGSVPALLYLRQVLTTLQASGGRGGWVTAVVCLSRHQQQSQ